MIGLWLLCIALQISCNNIKYYQWWRSFTTWLQHFQSWFFFPLTCYFISYKMTPLWTTEKNEHGFMFFVWSFHFLLWEFSFIVLFIFWICGVLLVNLNSVSILYLNILLLWYKYFSGYSSIFVLLFITRKAFVPKFVYLFLLLFPNNIFHGSGEVITFQHIFY